MTEQQEKAMRQALEALIEVTGWQWAGPMRVMDEVEDAITALTAALEQPQEKYQYGTPLLDAMTGKAQEALDKKAGNAREIGLDYEPEQPAQQEPVAWVNWCAATGKRSVSFECESELASEPLYAGITQNTQGHYSNDVSKAQSTAMNVIVVNLVREGINKHRARELAEHFVKRCNYTNGYCTGRTDLLAEQKEQQEPAAYFFTGIKGDGGTHGPHLIWKPEYMDSMSEQMGAVATPLYTRPQAPEPVIDKSAAIRIATALGWEPKRKPLTDEQISKIDWKQNETLHDFARAIEAAHGIGEKK